MKIRCPKCDKAHDIKNIHAGDKVECTCSYKFIIGDNNISKARKLNGTDSPQQNDYDFSRCICQSCSNRLNTEELNPGKRFECPYCKAQNIVGQNLACDIAQHNKTTSATITDGGHAYAEDKNSDGSVPEIIGGCRIEKLLGEGGMGRVYLARHGNLDIPVALKTMFPGYGNIKSFSERFFQEARTAAKINHQNVVHVYDCGNENNSLYIIMEYVPGGSTGDLLKKRGKLSPDTVINIAENMCKALIEAKKFGIIHRDIKPDNIMCAEDDVYKLADLGLAKQISPDKVDQSLTMEAIGMGTPLYTPPEQSIDAKNCDIRADIYALGATLYYLACGKPPFESESLLELFKMHSEEKPEPPTSINSEIPESLEKIIEKCMGKTPDKRYQTPEEMLADIKLLKEEMEPPSFEPAESRSIEKNKDSWEDVSPKFPTIKFLITLIVILFFLIGIVIFVQHCFLKKTGRTTSSTDKKTVQPTAKTKLPDTKQLEKLTAERKLRHTLTFEQEILKEIGNPNAKWTNVKVYPDGKIGKKATFSGDGIINMGKINITPQGTWCCWVRIPEGTSLKPKLGIIGVNGAGLNIQNDKFVAKFHDKQNGNIGKANAITGKWIHLALTWKVEKRKFYVDGELKAETACSGTPGTSQHSFIIGAQWDGTGCHFIGDLDEIYLFEDSLTHEEIKIVYSANKHLTVIKKTIPPRIDGGEKPSSKTYPLKPIQKSEPEINKENENKTIELAKFNQWCKKNKEYTQSVITNGKGVQKALNYYGEIIQKRHGTEYEKIAKAEIIKLKSTLEKIKNELFSGFSNKIIKGKFADALKTCEEAAKNNKYEFLEKDLENIRIILKDLTKTNIVIKDSFKKQIGKRISLNIDGKRNQFKLKRIKDDIILATMKMGRAELGKKFNFSSISIKDRIKYLSKLNSSAVAIYTGSYEFHKKNYTAARKYFKKAGPLADTLLRQIPQIKKEISIKSIKNRNTATHANLFPIQIIQNIFHGKVRYWNPKTREIKLEYDFDDKEQLQDWLTSRGNTENWNNSMLVSPSIKNKERGLATFFALIELKTLEFNLLPSTSHPVWYFNFPDLEFKNSDREMYGIMRRSKRHGGSCIYGKAARKATKKQHKINKKYSMKLSINKDDLVWEINGKTFLKHKYDKGGEICAIGGARGKAVYDDVIIDGILNRKWLDKVVKELKNNTAPK